MCHLRPELPFRTKWANSLSLSLSLSLLEKEPNQQKWGAQSRVRLFKKLLPFSKDHAKSQVVGARETRSGKTEKKYAYFLFQPIAEPKIGLHSWQIKGIRCPSRAQRHYSSEKRLRCDLMPLLFADGRFGASDSEIEPDQRTRKRNEGRLEEAI